MLKATRPVRLSPYVSFRHGSHYYVINGQTAYKLSRREWSEFRELGFPFAAAKHFRPLDFRNSREHKSFVDWAHKQQLSCADFKNRKSLRCHELADCIAAAIVTWKYGVSSESLQKALTKKPGQYLYLIETAWFAHSASEYLGPIAKACRDSKLRKALTEICKSERLHYRYLLRDLGLTKAQLQDHDAAPGTRILVAYLRDLGVRNPISFLCSAALLEADALSAFGYKKHISRIERSLRLPLPGFLKHFKLDLAAAHSEVWRDALVAFKPKYSLAASKEIINDLHVTRHAIMSWHESIGFRAAEANEIGKNLKIQNASMFLRTPLGPEGFWRGP